jgi:hypothetical protein
LETLETGLSLHAAASNAKVIRHKSEMMPLNGVEIHAPFNTIRQGQSICYLGVFFKDGAVLCLNVFTLSQLWFAENVVLLEQKVFQGVAVAT